MATATQGERVIIDFQSNWAELNLPPSVREVLSAAPLIQTPETRQQLMDWALGRSTGETDWTLGNRDDHDKNFAFLMDSRGVWKLSPAYDITWSRLKREHTMLVGSKGREITKGDCIAVAESAGVLKRRAKAILDEVVTSVEKFESHAASAALSEEASKEISASISANTAVLLK